MRYIALYKGGTQSVWEVLGCTYPDQASAENRIRAEVNQDRANGTSGYTYAVATVTITHTATVDPPVIFTPVEKPSRRVVKKTPKKSTKKA